METRTLEDWRDLAIRNQADLENARKRHQRDISGVRERAIVQLSGELLGTLDSLERAVEHNVDGAQIIFDQMLATLNRFGVASFDPTGEPFDPTLHEAITTQPAPDGTSLGTIMVCIQRGYRLNEHIVRAARVVVAGG